MADNVSSSPSGGKSLPGREQCYICWTHYNPDPPPQTQTLDALTHAHELYLEDLERRGILFGSGSLQDEEGNRAGAGLFIIRARTRAEAEEIAYQEPLTVAGVRTIELIPWRRRGGSFAMTINFANGELRVDTRSYQLTPMDDSPANHGDSAP